MKTTVNVDGCRMRAAEFADPSQQLRVMRVKVQVQGEGPALKLEELSKGAQVVGIDPEGPVAIVSVDAIGTDAVSVWYRSPQESTH